MRNIPILTILFLLFTTQLNSQVADLDVVWDYEHFGKGWVSSVHPTSSRDGYLAAGSRQNSDELPHIGTIIKFNESGALVNRIEIDIKEVYTPSTGVSYLDAVFSIYSAFEYKDTAGKTWITAFAQITNKGEILSELSDIMAPNRYYLRKGIIILKVDPET